MPPALQAAGIGRNVLLLHTGADAPPILTVTDAETGHAETLAPSGAAAFPSLGWDSSYAVSAEGLAAPLALHTRVPAPSCSRALEAGTVALRLPGPAGPEHFKQCALMCRLQTAAPGSRTWDTVYSGPHRAEVRVHGPVLNAVTLLKLYVRLDLRPLGARTLYWDCSAAVPAYLLAPRRPTVAALSPTELKLSWKAPKRLHPTCAVETTVWVHDDAGFQRASSTRSTSARLPDLAPGTVYAVRLSTRVVRARDTLPLADVDYDAAPDVDGAVTYVVTPPVVVATESGGCRWAPVDWSKAPTDDGARPVLQTRLSSGEVSTDVALLAWPTPVAVSFDLVEPEPALTPAVLPFSPAPLEMSAVELDAASRRTSSPSMPSPIITPASASAASEEVPDLQLSPIKTFSAEDAVGEVVCALVEKAIEAAAAAEAAEAATTAAITAAAAAVEAAAAEAAAKKEQPVRVRRSSRPPSREPSPRASPLPSPRSLPRARAKILASPLSQPRPLPSAQLSADGLMCAPRHSLTNSTTTAAKTSSRMRTWALQATRSLSMLSSASSAALAVESDTAARYAAAGTADCGAVETGANEEDLLMSLRAQLPFPMSLSALQGQVRNRASAASPQLSNLTSMCSSPESLSVRASRVGIEG